jgi:hypothetical protein
MPNKKTVYTNLILLFLICNQFSIRATAQSGRPVAIPETAPETAQS